MADKETVKNIFDDIAPSYDKLNHLLSLNIDKRWRRLAVKSLSDRNVKNLLDVACGTGDFSIKAAQSGIPNIIGVDVSKKMIEIGQKKVVSKNLTNRITLQYGDCEELTFFDKTFDAVTVAFGVRNFENLESGLSEICRVLKNDGQIVILEFSVPERFPIKQLYLFYFKKILPAIGGWISGNKGAYKYLPDSVSKFPQGDEFIKIMHNCGFVCTQRKLSFGIASLYLGQKK